MSTDDADTNKDAETTEDTSVTEGAATAKAESAEAAKVEDTTVAKPELSKAEPEPKPAEAATDEADKKADKAAPKADADAAEPATSKRSASLPLIAAFVAGVLAVAAITAVVVFFLQGKDRGDKLDAIRDSTQAGCTFGKDVSSYDYTKNLDDYFAKVKSQAGGEFLKEFGDASSALKDAMVQAKVKSWADDVQCGYQSGDKSEAKVLVTLTEYRTNFTQTTPERQFVVLIAQLTKSGDKWQVEKLDSPMLKGGGTGLPGAPDAPAPGNVTPDSGAAPGAPTPGAAAPGAAPSGPAQSGQPQQAPR
ncbi:hypothetical protein OG203_25400 [Nocardia sp. NBC_01499]|uniref:hypothetical protein n=1 Tax=Nocardia sp. NBC_01499 TaxID=2903597 RepID=UPI00386EB579